MSDREGSRKTGLDSARSERAPRMEREERISLILEMARDVFCETGYQNTAVADIAKRLSVSEATIFKYFPSKFDLLNSVIEHWYGAMFGDYSKELEFMSGAREKLKYLVWRHLCTIRDQPAMCRLMFTEVRRQPGYSGSVLRRMNQKYTGMFLTVIQGGSASGEFRNDLPVELLRNLVFGGIEHHAWAYLYDQGSLDADEIADQLTGLVCEGIAVSRRPDGSDIEGRLAVLVGELERHVRQLKNEGEDSK